MHLCAGNFFAPSQLRQAHLNFRIHPLTERRTALAEFEPFQKGFSLIFVQVFDFFDCQFEAAHGGKGSRDAAG